MDPVDPVALARRLIDIDSTTGKEAEAAGELATYLRGRGYDVAEQPIAGGRFNVFASLGAPPEVVFSTHIDCVPPFFPSREERGLIVGRGACDAKGIIAAQVAAAERLKSVGQTRFGLLFVSGEERGSDGAKTANEQPPGSVRFLINGEPTDNRLGLATRGLYRVRLNATGRAAHSSHPELGESAIDKLLDALMVVRGIEFPEDPLLGRVHYTVGLIEGGVAPNVVSPHASAELSFRTTTDGVPVRAALGIVEALVAVEPVLDIPAVRMRTLPGFETAVFPFTTDVPLLTRWGAPLLVGPGSIQVAHTDEEHLAIDELFAAVDLYELLATQLLTTPASPTPA